MKRLTLTLLILMTTLVIKSQEVLFEGKIDKMTIRAGTETIRDLSKGKSSIWIELTEEGLLYSTEIESIDNKDEYVETNEMFKGFRQGSSLEVGKTITVLKEGTAIMITRKSFNKITFTTQGVQIEYEVSDVMRYNYEGGEGEIMD